MVAGVVFTGVMDEEIAAQSFPTRKGEHSDNCCGNGHYDDQVTHFTSPSGNPEWDRGCPTRRIRHGWTRCGAECHG